jgi:carboxypeptidase C (cathepsin A)
MEAITEFFEDYSEYLNQPLFISGESYGGMIATMVGLRIDERNSLVQSNPSLGTQWQLKGLILGNP